MPNTRSVDTVKTSPAANPSVMLRFDFGPSQEIAPLHAVHLATCDLAEHALNGSFTIGLSPEHVYHPQAGFGHKFYSRESRRTKRDRVTRNGADSRFSVYVKSKCFQQSRGYILVVLVTAYPLLQFQRTFIFFW